MSIKTFALLLASCCINACSGINLNLHVNSARTEADDHEQGEEFTHFGDSGSLGNHALEDMQATRFSPHRPDETEVEQKQYRMIFWHFDTNAYFDTNFFEFLYESPNVCQHSHQVFLRPESSSFIY